MTQVAICNAVSRDFPRIIKINDTEEKQTSPMDLEKLESLARMSCYFKAAFAEGSVVAFLIALREGQPYKSENYAWFERRFDEFIYVDRIVVDAHFSGLKIGRQLYADLFAYAESTRIKDITCEYNIIPPNPASKAFHDKFGFKELDTQWVANGTKCVSLQAALI
jgi:predicted GNAT superfamily acetyltransferase